MAVPSEISVLVERLESLERRMCGENVDSVSPVVVSSSLEAVQNRLNSAMTGRAKMKSILNRVDEIELYLNPTFGERMTLEDTAKMDIILTKKQSIEETAALLDSVLELKRFLDSEHIKATPSMEGNLTRLSQINIDQHIKATEISDNVKDLLLSYNNIISTISKQFVQWDDIVTKLELSRSKQKQ